MMKNSRFSDRLIPEMDMATRYTTADISPATAFYEREVLYGALSARNEPVPFHVPAVIQHIPR